ncbi:hypothetical protein PEBR_02856 [Penicillium brasilianum]|uniref:C2H2-type domain-containing protein n=1 Tax=Penicillium brasilianum TaxID=104259 RepID=A0A1S9RZL9_PENBI|nr:hypothetical protein PEBR_02856 [Penicillium brasilianum]
MATVSELLQSCLAQLTSLISSTLSEHTEEVTLQEWSDELGRLRVWAANIGAHHTRQSSLDYRLRDASHIKNQVLRLLERVRELLTDLTEVLDEEKDDESQNTVFEGLGDISEDGDSPSEIQQIHQGLVETITQLYQMSMIIRQPAQHDRLVGTDKLDAEPFQFWAKQHISNKYPDADELVVNRISSAMARQRAILKYRERHHLKTSQGINCEGDGKSTVLSETVATDIIPGQSSDIASEAGGSETSYGSVLLKGTGIEAPRIPPIPQNGAQQRPFECPYCFYIIVVRDTIAWARHIFRDLMPYVCIFPGCPTPNKLYEGRRKWYQHIRQAHPSVSVTDSVHDCSICKKTSLSTTTFQRHVGQHLEELALFSLPRTGSDEDDNAVTDEEESAGSVADVLSDATLDHIIADQRLQQRDDIDDFPPLISQLRRDIEGFPPPNDPAPPRSTESESQDGASSKDSGEAEIDSSSENKRMTREMAGLKISFSEESLVWKVDNIPDIIIGGREKPPRNRTSDVSSGLVGERENDPPSTSLGETHSNTRTSTPAIIVDFDEHKGIIIPDTQQAANRDVPAGHPKFHEVADKDKFSVSNEMASEGQVSESGKVTLWYCLIHLAQRVCTRLVKAERTGVNNQPTNSWIKPR